MLHASFCGLKEAVTADGRDESRPSESRPAAGQVGTTDPVAARPISDSQPIPLLLLSRQELQAHVAVQFPGPTLETICSRQRTAGRFTSVRRPRVADRCFAVIQRG